MGLYYHKVSLGQRREERAGLVIKQDLIVEKKTMSLSY